MNLSRLLLLGALDRHGPRHGHRIRRAAEQANVASWGGVTVGALYREMRALDAEGLIAAVRTETEGRRPARTIYEITAEGRRELAILREQAIAEPRQAPDAVAVALAFGGVGERGVVLPLLEVRREVLHREVEGIAAERARLVAEGILGAVDVTVFRRGELLRAAEVAWIDETIVALEADAKRRGGSTPKRATKKAEPPSASRRKRAR
ncbi:MAG: PadR family transcriptional regulator [Gemmatimonadaceae bacterium]|jgi:DNA-binding PadR family transcriptional regulator